LERGNLHGGVPLRVGQQGGDESGDIAVGYGAEVAGEEEKV
jgi:hypothetical protein